MPEIAEDDAAEPEAAGTLTNSVTRKAGGSMPV